MAMKRVKEGNKVLMGMITMQTYDNQLHLFDGRFTTGYRVVKFRIIPKSPSNQEEVLAVLTTKERGSVPSVFNFNFKSHIAYAGWNIPNQTEFSEYELIVDGNMAIEDIWLSCYTTGDETDLNYYIELEKYTFPAWDGAGVMAENNI